MRTDFLSWPIGPQVYLTVSIAGSGSHATNANNASAKGHVPVTPQERVMLEVPVLSYPSVAMIW